MRLQASVATWLALLAILLALSGYSTMGVIFASRSVDRMAMSSLSTPPHCLYLASWNAA